MRTFGQREESVYFEHQAADDNLCGLHCLNALLQAPIYDEASSNWPVNSQDQSLSDCDRHRTGRADAYWGPKRKLGMFASQKFLSFESANL